MENIIDLLPGYSKSKKTPDSCLALCTEEYKALVRRLEDVSGRVVTLYLKNDCPLRKVRLFLMLL
jgi:hypothetical protein